MLPFIKEQTVRVQVVRRNETPCLLASFNASSPPLLWQFDLEKMANHTITLREKEGEWDLGLVLPDGAFTVVAHFDERGSAEEAYKAVQKAMLRGEVSRFWLFVRWALFFFLAFATLNLAGFFLGRPLQVTDLKGIGAAMEETLPGGASPWSGVAEERGDLSSNARSIVNLPSAPPAPKEMEFGVPMSADDVLEPPQD